MTNNFLNEEFFQRRASKLGSPTSPMTPKQLEEMSKRLNEGLKNVEIGAIQPETFDTIPKEHFQEVRRLAKLTDTNMSMHAPIVDPAGFQQSQDGAGVWSEQLRKNTVNQISSFFDRAAYMIEKDEKKDIPVVVHASSMFSRQQEEGLVDPNNPEKKLYRAMAAVNQDTGQITVLHHKERIRPGTDKKELFDVYKSLQSINKTTWDEEKLKLLSYEKDARGLIEFDSTGQIDTEKSNSEYATLYLNTTKERGIIQSHIDSLETDMHSKFLDMFDKMSKIKEDTYFKNLDERSWDIHSKKIQALRDHIDKMQVTYNNLAQREISPLYSELERLYQKKDYVGFEAIRRKIEEKEKQKPEMKVKASKEQRRVVMQHLGELPDPQTWVPLEGFAREKASQTVAEVMLRQFEKHKDKSPICALENWAPDKALSTGEGLRGLVEESRKKFVDLLIKEKDISRSEATVLAEKLIGATWDVGHINEIRRSGIKTEEELKKRVIEETRRLTEGKNIVKHLHITDNFGFGDSHLPPGMGNVPIKEIIEELEKQGFTERGIVEAGNFVKEFGI